MNRRKPVDRFHFDKQPSVNQQVNDERLWKIKAIDMRADRQLSFDMNALFREAICQQLLIDSLKEPWPNIDMNTHRRIQNPRYKRFNFLHRQTSSKSLRPSRETKYHFISRDSACAVKSTIGTMRA
jgi:hypothetical protein